MKFKSGNVRHLLKKIFKRLFKKFQQNWLQQDISHALRSAENLCQNDFPVTVSLPANFGSGLPERVVELLLARLLYYPDAKVLDVGHANSMLCHLEMIKNLSSPKHITGIDIAEPNFNASKFYSDSKIGSIAKTGYECNHFDGIWCISALEHFGQDNSGYTNNFSFDNELPIKALLEMLRILKPGGKILITVPFGKYENHGWLINYDIEHWQELLNIARPNCTLHELYFRHTFGGGWAATSAEELRYVGYFDQHNRGAGALAAVTIVKNH